MAKKDIKFTLDTIDSRYSPVGTVKQLDSVFFYIKITENGVTKDLTGQTIKLFAIKEDKKIVEQTTKINITNQREGLVEIELLNAAIQVHGFTYFELEISDSNGIISTSDFILRVNKRVGSDEAIESTNEVATLKKIEEYVAQAKVELQEFKKLQTEMLKTNNSINSQEALRLEAEKSRVDAEKGRVTAETKRDEAFKKFEGKINANTEELETARTATTGENFNSIDERIDCEVNRINKKIEISFLEQEDSESHIIENTVEGMTKDMIVNGRLLQNLFTTVSSKLRLNDVILEDTAFVVNPVKGRYPTLYDLDGLYRENTNYTVVIDILENTLQSDSSDMNLLFGNASTESVLGSTLHKFDISNGKKGRFTQSVKTIPDFSVLRQNLGLKMYLNNSYTGGKLKFKVMVLENSVLHNDKIPNYFKGIKSFGEEESKIISLSTTTNFVESFSNTTTLEVGQYSDYKLINVKLQGELYQGLFKDGEFINTSGSTVVYFYDESKHQIEWLTLNGKPRLFDWKDILVKAKYYRIYDNSNRIVFDDFFIGKEPTYSKSKLDKKDISLSEHGFDEGLRGLPAVSDELNYLKSVAIKRIGKIILNGDESWQGGSTDSGDVETARFFVSIPTAVSSWGKIDNIMCNNFKVIPNNWNVDKEGVTIDGSLNLGIRIKRSELTTQNIEGFKQWLRKNETIVYYQLAEPIETPLNKNINLKTFEEKTYIRFENALSGTSSFKAPVNAVATISRLNRENKALEEENLSLRQDLESTTLTLTDSDLALVKQNVDMDFRLMEVEFALDIPQAILSSDINFKNKKGEVKTMARTPYEMMKIVILSGDYDREDYMHKVGKYYERGRMTKEEHDELISLMTADEVISK